MDPTVWLENAHDELLDLVGQESLDPLDAWRFCALLARLENAEGRRASDEMRGRLSEIAAAVGEPDGQQYLEALADALDDDVDDAWGPLLDALLDVDDAVGVLQVLHRSGEALELAGRAAGLVSLSPERVMPLGTFAEMRLATLRHDAMVNRVWRAVESAPALLFAEALPAGPQFNDAVERVAASTPWLSGLLAGWPIADADDAPAGIHLLVGSVEKHELTATLGIANDASMVSWGEIRTVAASIGTRVTLRFGKGQVWYRTAARSAPLPTGAWDLEAGDAPVLLVVTNSQNEETLEGAISRGAKAAGVLVTEA